MLKKEELVVGRIVTQDGETFKLRKEAGYESTFINEDYAPDAKYRHDDTIVLAKERWEVEIQPSTVFDKPFVTHRYVVFYKQTYEEYCRSARYSPETGHVDRSGQRKEQLVGKKDSSITDRELQDNFNGII